jgi:2-polyprenyl-3-methyl-5-hydroxy-6-metoxy-1,4-benzoquinol methylase
MAYRLTEDDPEPTAVRTVTFVPFLPDGRCVVLPGPALPAGDVRPGEHYLLDTAVRIPLEQLGFRFQRVHPFATDGDHVYLWLDGDLRAERPRVTARPEALTDLLPVVGDAVRSFRTQSDASYYADNVRVLEPAYLRGTTPQAGSGFGGDAAAWRARRGMVVDGLHRSGTFLDVGCANGLLMESVREWAAERGLVIEPHGIDLAPGLVDLARKRLPHWADRIEVGNAIDWTPAEGRRFTFVHMLLDAVPRHRRPDLVRHTLTLVEPGGRLLVSHYAGGPADRAAQDLLRDMGFPVAGAASSARATTAWLDQPGGAG